MITKRSFLKGSAGLLGSTLLCKHLNGFESYGKNIIESGKDFKDTLFYNFSTDSFELGTWDVSKWDLSEFVQEELPTWSEYLEDFQGICIDPNCSEITESIYKDFGVKPDAYEQSVDPRTWFFDFNHSSDFFRNYAPPCSAFDYLMNLDLGPELEDDPDCNPFDAEHGLVFFNYYHLYGGPYPNYVKALSPLTLTMLEKKLIELGEPTRIMTYHDSGSSFSFHC
jgi:hypothetical protein